MYVYIEECILRQQIVVKASFMKETMEHRLLFLIVIFQVFLLFFLG